MGQAYINNVEFDTYVVTKDTHISLDFATFRSVLKSISKFSNGTIVTMEYPYKDNKFLILFEDESFTSQFYLDTYEAEFQNNSGISQNIIASMKFSDVKIIKQAMEVACHGRPDKNVFLTFSTHKPMLYFLTEDDITSVRARVTIPFGEHVESQIRRECERNYSAKVLKGITSFPKCKEIDVKMHEEGILEIEITVSANMLVRHFINPCDNLE
ncbi:hypothetical protein SteCoe_6060 [Stentor coeruleus]|uniref:Proliferating cell nuclear antigen PCNA N-terminal domain-containing protein n=1 Tax=Stentor coeruleus TaxID=5963 RepID=A0A1R2CQY0_9CILI|nr:hypothetical protein SteCoe_6060 [Stentor coeruleus]